MVEVKSHVKTIDGKKVFVKGYSRKEPPMTAGDYLKKTKSEKKERDYESEWEKKVEKLHNHMNTIDYLNVNDSLRERIEDEIVRGEITTPKQIDKTIEGFRANIEPRNAYRPSARGREITDNDGVVMAFANDRGNVRNGNDSLATSENGEVLYSYATPIAFNSRVQRKTLINSNSYYNTTATQRNKVVRELGSYGKLVTPKELKSAMDFEKVNYSEGRL